jgi:tetratricopeptide (TPR) repeat protein
MIRRHVSVCAAKLALCLVPLLSVATGCAASTVSTTPQSPAAPRNETVATTVITVDESGTPAELFERGKKLYLEEKYREAARLFDLVQAGEPEGKNAAMALFHAGNAYEMLGDSGTAVARYTKIADSYPKEPVVKLAHLRVGRLAVLAEKWADLAKTADALLQRQDLSISETIEAQGNKALSLAEMGQAEAATRHVEKARDLMEKHHIGESGRIPHEVALVYYALGEVRRIPSEKIKFDPTPDNFGDAFERRAQGLLDAQAAYTEVMRTTDATWATMAGFRVGQLYSELHRDVMQAKFPAVGKTDRDRQLFEGAMRLRYRILLEKGLKMMVSTVSLTERVGEEGTWCTRAKEARANLERTLAAENAALQKLPFAEADLRKLLDDLQNRREQRDAAKTSPP